MSKNTLDFAISIAKDAGQILLNHYGKELTRNIKSDEADYSTEADHASEAFIIGEIQKHFPQDAIVAEESGEHAKLGAKYTWIIDPLDGTKNFANNKNSFGVFIARCKGTIPELVVGFDPVAKQLATATLGGGTYLNDQKILLSNKVASSEKPFGANTELHSRLQPLGLSKTNHSAIGATMNTLQGNYRAYACNAGAVWDFVVPALLFSEAGWKVTNFANTKFIWDGIIAYDLPGIIAAPPELHSKIVRMLTNNIP
ncbi:MAG TPA: inositol monophosphatase family protein [Candidatus Andersenbacteria bacterium]|nr:inositol monophosphatase family protein [Candidatus Andersenbacteria bacterium]